ncbi:MAG: type IX secretion system protein PorQ [Cyclobacteriaceae bacterium]
MRILAVISLLLTFSAQAQFGQYQSLELPAGTRSAALGGTMVSLADGELMQFMNNPAVLDSVEVSDVTFNYNPYFADVNAFSGAYFADLGKIGPVAFGLTYLSFGEFTETDDTGNEIGRFNAYDYVLTVGKSQTVGPFTFGVNMKFAQSAIDSYSSSVMAFDLGGIYRFPDQNVTFGLAFKNFGFRLSDYATTKSQMPFDVQMGVTIKPEYMPFRFTITTYNLVEENLVFKPETDEQTSRTSAAFDKILRRINFGTELILNEALQFQFGYNHLRRQEMKVGDSAEGAGLSYGFSLGIKKFKFRYARSKYHAAGGANFISVQTNLNSYKKIL